MPYDSWHQLHNNADAHSPSLFRCPVCRGTRKTTPHARKIFLVAERLTWDDAIVSIHDKDQTEKLTWEVNYELGIVDPFVEDSEQLPGGRKSQTNKFHPYQNDYEMKQALNLIFVKENITEVSWALWYGMQMSLQNMSREENESPTRAFCDEILSQGSREPLQLYAGNGTRETTSVKVRSTVSHDLSARSSLGLPTPPSSYSNEENISVVPKPLGPNAHSLSSNVQGKKPAIESPGTALSSRSLRITSYKTLQDFYGLLDQIERGSYVGAVFLEAYAEHLRDDMCKDCWFKRNVQSE